MITKNIKFKNFSVKKNPFNIKKKLSLLLNENNLILKTLGTKYKYSYSNKFLQKFKKNNTITLIGMGGSILGSQAIYDFLKFKIKKNFFFINNLNNFISKKIKKTKNLNLIISKSGNTLETITIANVLIKKKNENIFITENKNSYLRLLAKKLKADIIDHNNYIGGRYSVLSEVGMLPAQLMGFRVDKFRKLNESC